MKRILSILMAVLLIASLAAACATNRDDPATTEETDAPAQNVAIHTPAGVEGDDPADDNDGEGPRRGGTLVFSPTSEGSGPVGLPWAIGWGDVAVPGPFNQALIAEWMDGTINHVLAISHEVDVENRHITFQLRPNVIFHDHSPFNAEVVVWNFGRIAEHSAWPTGLLDVVALDDMTVRFYWETIENSTLGRHSQSFTSMVAYETYGIDWLRDNPIGTGPFTMVSYVRGAYAFYERWEHYWDEGRPYLDAVHMIFLSDPLVQSLGLQQSADGEGRIDVVATHTQEITIQFFQMGYNIMIVANQCIALWLPIDDPANPLYNPLVRQAISMAVDRELIAETLGAGVKIPSLQFVPPGFRGRVDDPTFGAPAYNPERARELMAEAGFPDGFSTNLYPQPGRVSDAATVAIHSMLSEIGIDAEIVIMDMAGHTQMRREIGWSGIVIDMYGAWIHVEDSLRGSFVFGHDQEGVHPERLSIPPSPELRRLVDAAFFFGDNTQQIIDTAAYILAPENLWMIPMWNQGIMNILHPRVAGMDLPSIGLPFDRMWLREGL